MHNAKKKLFENKRKRKKDIYKAMAVNDTPSIKPFSEEWKSYLEVKKNWHKEYLKEQQDTNKMRNKCMIDRGNNGDNKMKKIFFFSKWINAETTIFQYMTIIIIMIEQAFYILQMLPFSFNANKNKTERTGMAIILAILTEYQFEILR